ncbi:hypothetical Protein pso3_08030 [Candidatus Phytoplasma solani]
MNEFEFYHAIYYELKKIDKLLNFNLTEKNFQHLLKHLKDIEDILKKQFKNQKITDIEQILLLTYDQTVTFLKDKHGLVKGDYFLDKKLEKVNKKIKRSDEGLEIHHFYEFKEKGLSNPEYAKNLPFKYQKSENLVYCDLLEHFILHLKIIDYSKNPNHFDVGKKGAEIIFNRLREIFYFNTFHEKEYKRKISQKIYYKKKDFWKCLAFWESLKIYFKYINPNKKS